MSHSDIIKNPAGQSQVGKKQSAKRQDSKAPVQLPLGVSLSDQARFENFYTPEQSQNGQLLFQLRQQLSDAGEPCIYIWGLDGAGKTHLLQAACHHAEVEGFAMQYLPLAELLDYPPEDLFDGLESLDLVCIDGLDALVDRPDWQRALFGLYNQLRDCGVRLVVSASQGPHQLPIELADLRSRLAWGMSYQVLPLDDDDKCRALQLRARQRGLEISDELGRYIISRASRRTSELFELLDKLDAQSLASQRKLTIPFVKDVLGL